MEKLLKKLKTDKYPWVGTKLSSKEVAIVIDALEKQIPKEPTKDGRKYFCLDCRGSVGEVVFDETIYGMFFCSNCGQKINWED